MVVNQPTRINYRYSELVFYQSSKINNGKSKHKNQYPHYFLIVSKSFEESYYRPLFFFFIFIVHEILMSKCQCGRSPTGMCKGWHGLSKEEYEQKLAEYKKENKDE